MGKGLVLSDVTAKAIAEQLAPLLAEAMAAPAAAKAAEDTETAESSEPPAESGSRRRAPGR